MKIDFDIQRPTLIKGAFESEKQFTITSSFPYKLFTPDGQETNLKIQGNTMKIETNDTFFTNVAGTKQNNVWSYVLDQDVQVYAPLIVKIMSEKNGTVKGTISSPSGVYDSMGKRVSMFDVDLDSDDDDTFKVPPKSVPSIEAKPKALYKASWKPEIPKTITADTTLTASFGLNKAVVGGISGAIIAILLIIGLVIIAIINRRR